MNADVRVEIATDADMIPARAEGRALADRLGFSQTDATLIATAISEVARNIVIHAGKGEILLTPVYEDSRYGIVVVARDDGPGIRDVETVLQDGYSGVLGGLMDDFDIASDLGKGTTVTMTKWRTRDELERIREKRRPGG